VHSGESGSVHFSDLCVDVAGVPVGNAEISSGTKSNTKIFQFRMILIMMGEWMFSGITKVVY
jgi:hypothetical protein